MTSREVAVELLLKVRQYLDNAAAADARTAVLEERMHQLDRTVEKTEHDMAKLGETAGKTKVGIGSFGDNTNDARKQVKSLDEQIEVLRAHLHSLELQFVQTGDKSLLSGISSDRGQISQLERIKKDLSEVEKATEVAGGGLLSLLKLNTDAVSAVPFKPILIGAAAAVAPVLVPAIGAAVAGAVVGIGGVGGIAGGIASASQNPRVRNAAAKFGADISSMFFGSESSTAFVEPIVTSLDILSTDFRKADFGAAFAKAAPYVSMLAEGVGDLVDNAMPGFNAVMSKSGAITAVLSHGLAGTGTALSSFLSDAAASRGTIEGLRFLFAAINDTIIGLGHTLRWLGDRFHDYTAFATDASGALSHWLGDVPILGSSLKDSYAKLQQFADGGEGVTTTLHAFNPVAASAASALQQMTGDTNAGTAAFQRYTLALQRLDATLDDTLDKRHALNNAQLAEKQGWVDLAAALDHKRGLNLGEQQAIEAQSEALERERQAAIAASDGSVAAQDKANAAYDKGIKRLLAMAKAAGATPAELAKLKADYYITIHATTILDIRGGVAKAGTGVFDAGDLAHQHMAKHAAGGWDPGTKPFIAGERGTEIVWPAGPSYIMNHSDTMAYLARAQQWRGNANAGGGWRGPVSSTSAPAMTEQGLARAITRAMAGVTVVMDGRAVGRIQGLIADTYGRGG